MPLRDAAEHYWATTLAPWVAQLGAELALYRPGDLVCFTRTYCQRSTQWAGIAAASDAFDASSAGAWQSIVVQPFLEALAAAVLQLNPLPPAEELGAAVLSLLDQPSAAAAAAASVRQFTAEHGGTALVERSVARQTLTATQAEALGAAAAASAQHGGVGVEVEPSVDAAAFEKYLRDHRV